MYATFERFQLQMTLAQANGASHQGQCAEGVKALCSLPHIKRQLRKISDDDLASELKEYGAWDEEELQDRVANEERIVWIAAGNIVEENQR